MRKIKSEKIIEFSKIIETLRSKKPLVHHITNYVTVNDCANITLAVGASPVMADAVEEAGDIAAVASAVVLNIGTLNSRTVESMIKAGKSANERAIPVIFDPVGAGASQFRNETVKKILDEVKISVLRGNISEIRFVAGFSSNTKGVDASEADMDSDSEKLIKELAVRLGCVVAVTGATDIISDGSRVVYIKNGHPCMSQITGTGCMCSSLAGSFCGTSPATVFEDTCAAILCMGIAGEIAYENAGHLGNGSFHAAIIDAVSKMDAETMCGRAEIYEA